MRKRYQKSVQATDAAITSMFQSLEALKSKPTPTPTPQTDVMDVDDAKPAPPSPPDHHAQQQQQQLQALLKAAQMLQASLVTNHKSIGAAINKFGKAIDINTATNLGQLCAPTVRLKTSKINDAIAAHLFREGLFDIGRSFLSEASVMLEDDHIRPFERLHLILTAFRKNDFSPAIAWTEENRHLLESSDSHLEFRLHQLAFLQILQQGNCQQALAYAQRHFSTFPDQIHIVQKLMTCLLYTSKLQTSPYKDMISTSHRDDIERAISREYCRAQGLSRDSSLVTVVRCGTKAIPTLLKASRIAPRLQELSMDDALPVEIDVGRDCQFHSIFTCPVSKEESSEGSNVPMILPCGHVLSKQSIGRLPRGSPRFKCPYCPREQVSADCKELRF